MTSLTQLLRVHGENKDLALIWLKSILPLVMDPESTVQEKCLDFLEEMILDKIVSYAKYHINRLLF